MRKYAYDTEVPVDRSRTEIRHLLIQWGCDGIEWAEDLRAGTATVRFRWRHNDVDYFGRMVVRMPTNESLVREFRKRPTQEQLATKRAQRWRALHRVLLLTVRALLNSVDAGLQTAFHAFMPYLELPDGRTLGELVEQRGVNLLSGPTE